MTEDNIAEFTLGPPPDGKVWKCTGPQFAGFEEVGRFDLFGGVTRVLRTDGESVHLVCNMGGVISLNAATGLPTIGKFHSPHSTLAAATHGGRVAVAAAPTTWLLADGYPPVYDLLYKDRPRPKTGPVLGTTQHRETAADHNHRAVRLWRTDPLEPVACIGNVPAGVSSLAFSPDGRLLAAAAGGRVVLWDAHPDRAWADLRHDAPVHSAAFAGNSRYLFTFANDRSRGWDLVTGRPVPADRCPVYPQTVSADGNRWVSRVGGLRVCSAENSNAPVSLPDSDGAGFTALTADGRRCAALVGNAGLVVWDAATGQRLWSAATKDVENFLLSPDGGIVVLRSPVRGGPDEEGPPASVTILRMTNGQVLGSLPATNFDQKPVISRDGTKLAAVVNLGKDQAVARVWSMTGDRLAEYPFHSGFRRVVQFAPDGNSVVLIDSNVAEDGKSTDGTRVRQFSIHDGRLLGSTAVKAVDPATAVPSADGTLIAVGTGIFRWTPSGPAAVLVWDAAAARLKQQFLQAHYSDIWSLAFSPDGRTLASGGRDQLAKLWDIRSGQELAVLEGHNSTVLGLAFAPDGQFLVTCGYDRVAKLWAAPAPDRAPRPWAALDPPKAAAPAPGR